MEVNPYTVLAACYDVVMEHVEYERWAAYVHTLIERYHPDARRVLELGCGTGSFALSLQQLGDYRYVATDRSREMLQVAEAKADLEGAEIQFEAADFTGFRVDSALDVVILLYDGLNYLLEEGDVRELFRNAYNAVEPGGIFIVDQSTPSNSLNNEPYFEDRGEAEGVEYIRHSRYDPASRLHTTTLELIVEGKSFVERHVQRAYDLPEIRALIEETGFDVAAVYDGFTFDPAGPESERAHWVLRRPADS